MLPSNPSTDARRRRPRARIGGARVHPRRADPARAARLPRGRRSASSRASRSAPRRARATSRARFRRRRMPHPRALRADRVLASVVEEYGIDPASVDVAMECVPGDRVVPAGGRDRRRDGPDEGGAAARAAGPRSRSTREHSGRGVVRAEGLAILGHRSEAPRGTRRRGERPAPHARLRRARDRGRSSCASTRRACTSRRSAWIRWRMLRPSPVRTASRSSCATTNRVAVLTEDGVHDQAEAIVAAVGGGAALRLGGHARRRLGARDGRGHVASARADGVRAGRRRAAGDGDEPHRAALTRAPSPAA